MYEVMYPDNMRVGEFEGALCLAPELIKDCAIFNHEVGEKFQRDIALQFFIVCQPDNSHSAPPKHLEQRVTAKNFFSADRIQRSLEKATRTASLRRVGRDFGSALLTSSDCPVHDATIPIRP